MEKDECMLHWDFTRDKKTNYQIVIYYQKDEETKHITLTKVYKRRNDGEIETKNLLNSNEVCDKIKNIVQNFEKDYTVI